MDSDEQTFSKDPGKKTETNLDPEDWKTLRAQSHKMLNDMLDYVESIHNRPVWQPMAEEIRAAFRRELPIAPTDLPTLQQEFLKYVLPYTASNVHPGFMGWVQGGGTVIGMLAEMLAGGLNANCGGRDHAPIEVEQQIVAWVRSLFGFPEEASGLFVTGTSMANFVALLVARRALLGTEIRQTGLTAIDRQLVAYTSVAAHGCVARAMDYVGLGSNALRLIPVDGKHRIDLQALRSAITADRRDGLAPFLLIGTAGTVDVGAVDDLAALADLADEERIWFHVDGALGALGVLSPEIAPRLAGIGRAHSIALDFHKWGQVPYDAGFVLVRDSALHKSTFATSDNYLLREARGLAAGTFWPNDFGPDLSRGFRALKTWFTLRAYGTEQLGAMMSQSCRVARHLGARITSEPRLELMAPVQLNIVCFRYRGIDPDSLNAAIVLDVQESGVAAPSTTRIQGQLVIRAAIFNHRTRECDVDALVDAVLQHGDNHSGVGCEAD